MERRYIVNRASSLYSNRRQTFAEAQGSSKYERGQTWAHLYHFMRQRKSTASVHLSRRKLTFLVTGWSNRWRASLVSSVCCPVRWTLLVTCRSCFAKGKTKRSQQQHSRRARMCLQLEHGRRSARRHQDQRRRSVISSSLRCRPCGVHLEISGTCCLEGSAIIV